MIILGVTFVPGIGMDSEPVLRVEEDWELVVTEPDGLLNSPQMHTVMSPLGNIDWVYTQVTWNYREVPDALAGGVQVQGWTGDNMGRSKDVADNQLSMAAETITWTQRMETNGTMLKFQIQDGQSMTWGSFGGGEWALEGYFFLPNLDHYSPNVSVDNSFVTFGSNRVVSLAITEVRRYSASGLLSVDNTRRVVYEAN